MAFVASSCVALLGDLVSSRAAADRRALHDELVAALELPEGFQAYGAMMGSGGMIVMDDRSCMVEVAR